MRTYTRESTLSPFSLCKCIQLCVCAYASQVLPSLEIASFRAFRGFAKLGVANPVTARSRVFLSHCFAREEIVYLKIDCGTLRVLRSKNVAVSSGRAPLRGSRQLTIEYKFRSGSWQQAVYFIRAAFYGKYKSKTRFIFIYIREKQFTRSCTNM